MKFNLAPETWRTKAILFSCSLLLSACAAAPKEVASNQPGSAQPGSASSSSASPSSGVAVGHGGGAPSSATSVPMQSGGSVKWTVPSRWQTGPEKPMRSATYLIPSASGDSEGGECAVFEKIGGGVDANIKRWIGQFEQPDTGSSEAKAKRGTETINGFSVSTVDLTGIYAGGGMAMGQPSVKKPSYRLLGAIIEAPSGPVYFKLTGPEKTIAAAQKEFQELLKSVK